MITKLENQFEDLKEKFSKEQIVLVFAKFEAEEILDQTDISLGILTNVRDDDQMKVRFIVLQKQVKEFLELIDDLIESKNTTI